ncbi:hypothetical protein RXV86_05450 [Alisedimentitalea sp. MJ-SS2]|uniref:hypothetical protein n=1 Tax=Aliisedimentitalea sp. MJ-SS2 TaxID=3049795 RepID=UPI00290EA72B|nr:hypothetical protein [Alisedimentitalea sp. MJ-SS2]MDU8926820.1 hypothetical protein [Alisedimentitalea sp. MJ-SS2]
MLRFVMLLSLVIAAAGLTIWVVVLAARADQLNGATLSALLPLVLLASLALRALRRDPRD